MGTRNFLVEGVSCSGKTSVCKELQRRGYHAVNGDVDLAYQGDPKTGEPVAGLTGLAVHDHHLWRVDRVEDLVADREEAVSFLCGGSRNRSEFVGLFDGIFILEVDIATLQRRLDDRPPQEWGGVPEERDLVLHLHRTGDGAPEDGIVVDATRPLPQVVDEILHRSGVQTGRIHGTDSADG